MDKLYVLIVSAIGDPKIGSWFVVFLIAVAVFALVFAIYFLFYSYFDPVNQRLQVVTGKKENNDAAYKKFTGYIGNHFIITEKPGDEISYDRQRLIYAGYQKKDSLAHYYGIKIILTISLPLIAFLITSLFLPSLSSDVVIMIVASGLLIGFIGPSFYLDKKVERRQRVIRNSFPDAVDQLIICIEAGLGIDAALQRVAKDAALTNETLGQELGLVNAELRAGLQREQALKNLVNRTGVEDIRGLVAALIQSMRFGTSIGHTLRVYAEDMRDRRMQRAEEEAAKLAVKMLFPLTFCFFPGIFIVILGPAMIRIYSSFVH